MKKKKILITGNFNILHPGHVRLFKFAKSLGDFLYVGVNSDKIAKDEAYVSEKLRLEAIASQSLIDNVFLINKNISFYINKFKPDIIVKGKEFEKDENIEQKYLKKYGGKIIFSSGDIAFSTKELLNKENNISIERKLPKNDYFLRHKIKKTNFKKIINKFKTIRSLVIGDVIIDRYIFCNSLGMSQEDESIIYNTQDEKIFLGGAGIVAAHMSSLKSKVYLISVVGNDQNYKYVKKKISEYNILNMIIRENSRKTNIKERYKSKNKTVFRHSTLTEFDISYKLQNKIYNNTKKLIDEKKIDLIVLSDFNYGCLPDDLIRKIISLANKNKICITADSQISSQIGDVTKFKKTNLLTATEYEIRRSLKNNKDGLIVLAEKLRKETDSFNIFVKLQEQGILIHTINKNKKIKSTYENDDLEAINLNPIDTAGAGDSMLVVSSLSLSVKASIWEAAYLGSLASAVQISRIGNVPIKIEDLKKLL